MLLYTPGRPACHDFVDDDCLMMVIDDDDDDVDAGPRCYCTPLVDPPGMILMMIKAGW